MIYSINPSDLKNIIHTDSLLIDIRDQTEYQRVHVIHFINIPYPIFIKERHNFNKNKPIYIICESGHSAKEEAELLRHMGYQAFYIKGGMNAICTHSLKDNHSLF